jgi:exosortase
MVRLSDGSLASTMAAGPTRFTETSALTWATAALVSVAFLLLFGETILELLSDWSRDAESGHGLLLLPVAVYLAWRSRLAENLSASPLAGSALLLGSVALFSLGSIAAEFFTRRLAILLALAGLVVYYRGWAQARAWWLSFGLVLVAIPVPEVVLNSVTLPLQLLASRAAVVALQLRHVPADLAGNIIILPGTELFVAEACSGLRSLSALAGLSLLMGGTMLTRGWTRILLVALALPAALAANAFRVFLTGYMVYYVGPEATEGALHLSAGIGVFLLALGLVGAVLVGLRRLEGSSP